MHQELVERKRWISERRFLHALNYCMVLPGPEAQQLATYIGWLMHRTWGGIVAGGLFVLPSLFILIALSWIYLAFGDVPAIAGILYGIKPAVIVAGRAASRLAHRRSHAQTSRAVGDRRVRVRGDLRVRAAVSADRDGGRRDRLHRRTRRAEGLHAALGAAETGARPAAAVIDDTTPTPAHARFRWQRLALVVASCVALWGAGSRC